MQVSMKYFLLPSALPDEKGRLEILRIHCKKMIEGDFISKDVDLEHLAKVTKNFSGAEIAGLVGAARSIAFVRHMKVNQKFCVSPWFIREDIFLMTIMHGHDKRTYFRVAILL